MRVLGLYTLQQVSRWTLQHGEGPTLEAGSSQWQTRLHAVASSGMNTTWGPHNKRYLSWLAYRPPITMVHDTQITAALASLLFDFAEPQIIGKRHSESQLSYLFAHLHLLSSPYFSSQLFPLPTYWLLLSDSSHLCFSICPYCRKFDF